MAENKLKERWKAGKAAVNGWLAIPSGFSAEVMAQCGWDSVTVDMQHGVRDYQTMVQCFQAMDRLPVTKLVRVPWNEPGIIGKVLDGGAYGVICPGGGYYLLSAEGLLRGDAAVDDEPRAGHEGCVVRGEEHDALGDIVG
jgi:hypothetical protein